MRRMMLGLLAAAVLGTTCLFDLSLPAAAATVPAGAAAVVADTSTVRLHIEGMTCGGCAISARILLERMDGVEDAEVDYDSGIAVVTYDAARVTPDRMIAALRDAFDYTVVVVAPEADA